MPQDNGQRSKLLQGTDRLENASRRLEEAHRMALGRIGLFDFSHLWYFFLSLKSQSGTEEIGISTLQDLHRQRGQIERTRDTVRGERALKLIP